MYPSVRVVDAFLFYLTRERAAEEMRKHWHGSKSLHVRLSLYWNVIGSLDLVSLFLRNQVCIGLYKQNMAKSAKGSRKMRERRAKDECTNLYIHHPLVSGCARKIHVRAAEEQFLGTTIQDNHYMLDIPHIYVNLLYKFAHNCTNY